MDVCTSRTMEEWSDELCLQLIEIYKNYPLLWDPKNIDYYKKNKKIDAWTHIAKLLGKDVDSCKIKIVSLLASNRREKKKERKSKGTGKGASQVYESRWFAYDALKFLDDRDKPRKRLNTDMDQNTINLEDSPKHAEREAQELQKTDPSQPKNPADKSRHRDNILLSAVDVLKNVNKTLQAPKEVNDKNNIADKNTKAFTDFLATKIDSYSTRTKLAVQHAIFQIIMKADTGQYDYLYCQTEYHSGRHPGYQSNQYTTPSTYSQSSHSNVNKNQSSDSVEIQGPTSIETHYTSSPQTTMSDSLTADFSDFL